MAVLLFVFLVWTPTAYAWSRPVQGPVMQPFAYDEADPYSAGQHRGVDLGSAAGETVLAPATGTVSFAGTVPTNGKSVTIETADGYSVTLTHLGSIAVVKGATVAEQDAIGAVGPSGTPEVDGPYVHLGIRVTADPNGYLDPMTLLPRTAESDATASDSASSQPSSTATAPAPPAKKKPARSMPAGAHLALPKAAAGAQPEASAHDRGRTQESRMQESRGQESRAQKSRRDARPRPTSRPRARETRAPSEIATPRSHPSERTRSIRPPFVPSAPGLQTAAPSAHPRPAVADSLLGLACNGAAALIALGAALAASRSRRRRRVLPAATAQVLHLAPPTIEQRHFSRAA